MDNVDKLIEELKKAREELNKNVNMSYAGSPNMAKDGDKSPEAVDKEMRAVAEKGETADGRPVQGPSPAPAAVERDLARTMGKDETCSMVKTGDCYFSLFKNGQWDIQPCSVVDAKKK